ncbi:MAG TPA: sigma-70 family RNA polymerase sigma factor [Humisphaera sp.]|jgi:RNA polymerase sigma-70 factor (ECF subfamily)|nr:sigma-70 family RNA polymerase sigma factor [Humisphaera sp.]
MKWLARLIAPGSISDEQAMEDGRADGNSAAFALLVSRWEMPIRRLCMRMTGDAHRAEDLAQETFARVFARRSSFENGRKFSTWVWRIAINLCLEEGRRRRLAEKFQLQIAAAPTADQSGRDSTPHQQASEGERAGMVQQALAALPETQRAVVVLREFQGLKFREIAQVLEIPEGTAKSRMADALVELGRMLAPLRDECDEPAARAAESDTQRIVI